MSLITEGAEFVRPTGTDARAEPSLAGVGDYLALLKPRVMSLVVFTALVGMVVAPVHLHPVLAFFALLCIAVGAGAAGALAFTIFFYAVIYTMWLKPTTPQNIVIGGAAGAFPPMVGWAAATGGIG